MHEARKLLSRMQIVFNTNELNYQKLDLIHFENKQAVMLDVATCGDF